MKNPKLPVHESEVPVQSWYPGTDREIHGRALSDVGGSAKIGVGLLELPPGANTKPGHYHSREEEHLYLLEGELCLHLGERLHRLRPGSYVHFPASQPVPHHLENDGEVTARYLMIGERIDDDLVSYP